MLVPAAGEVRVLAVECPPFAEVLRADPPLLPEYEALPLGLLRDRLVRCDVFEVADWVEELPVVLELARPLFEVLVLARPPLERSRPERVEPVERLVVRELVAELVARLVALSESPLSLERFPQMSPEGKPPMRFAT